MPWDLDSDLIVLKTTRLFIYSLEIGYGNSLRSKILQINSSAGDTRARQTGQEEIPYSKLNILSHKPHLLLAPSLLLVCCSIKDPFHHLSKYHPVSWRNSPLHSSFLFPSTSSTSNFLLSWFFFVHFKCTSLFLLLHFQTLLISLRATQTYFNHYFS